MILKGKTNIFHMFLVFGAQILDVILITDYQSTYTTLENHCTRTAQSSRGGCSRRMHKIEYLAVNKGNILVNVLLLKIVIANHYHLK